MQIQALLVTTLIAGSFCQKIVFDNTTLISPCTTGARSGIDTYIITGTIGENITELLIQQWQPAVYIMLFKTASSQFNTICQFFLSGTTCVPAPTSRCECVYNTTTDQVHFTANNTVQADDSNAVINAQWQHRNATSIYSNKNYTLPKIYGNSETTTMQNLTTDITSRNSETTSTHIVATGGLTETPDDGFVLPFYVIAILVFVLGFILAFLHVFWGDWCCNKCRTRKTQRPKRRKADDESSESTEKTSSNNNV